VTPSGSVFVGHPNDKRANLMLKLNGAACCVWCKSVLYVGNRLALVVKIMDSAYGKYRRTSAGVVPSDVVEKT